jgi:hypothetical protein
LLLQHAHAVVDRAHDLPQVAVVAGLPHGVDGIAVRTHSLRIPLQTPEPDTLDHAHPVRVVQRIERLPLRPLGFILEPSIPRWLIRPLLPPVDLLLLGRRKRMPLLDGARHQVDCILGEVPPLPPQVGEAVADA